MCGQIDKPQQHSTISGRAFLSQNVEIIHTPTDFKIQLNRNYSLTAVYYPTCSRSILKQFGFLEWEFFTKIISPACLPYVNKPDHKV